MKILITGNAGFIGFHLSNYLLERGDEVIGIDNLNEYYDVRLKTDRLHEAGIIVSADSTTRVFESSRYTKYRYYRADICDKEVLEDIFDREKPDVVCHLAAQAGVRYSLTHPGAYIDSNIIGTFNILEASKKAEVDHLVYASSSSVYGKNSSMPFSVEDKVDRPVSLYAATKKSNELMAYTYSHLYRLPTTGLRFFTVYGPWGRPDMALFLFTRAIETDQPIQIFNHGNMIRDFTYVDDIIEGVAKVIDHPPSDEGDIDPYRLYNIGNNRPVRLMDFIETLESRLGKTARKEYLDMQPGDVKKTYADVSGLERDFAYRPDTPIKEGIDQFVTWYKQYYKS